MNDYQNAADSQWPGLPPLLFHVSGSEMLRDDSLRAVERASAARVDARIGVWPDMPHVFQLIGVLPETAQSLAEIGRFTAQRTGGVPLATAEVVYPRLFIRPFCTSVIVSV